MIIALLNQKGGVGKTTLATHIAGELTMQGSSVILLDADPQGSALDWTQRRSQNGLPRLFSAVGLARKPCIRKRQNSPGAAITSSSMAHPELPPSRAPRCSRRTWC
jgi:cellulose biosynthesis protein BcsQ